MYSRIITLCQRVPSISPFPSGAPGSVWDLEWQLWVGFASMIDAQRQEVSRG